MINLKKFHDSTLLSIYLDWASGKILIRARTFENVPVVKSLLFINFSYFSCSKELPWGESDCINEIRYFQEDNNQIFEIEIQSGDTIKIICRDVSEDQGYRI